MFFKSQTQRVRDVAKKIVDGLRDGTIVPDEPLAKPVNVPTPEFLEELRERARRYGWRGDYVVVEEFVRDLYREAGLEPGDLKPYDKS